VVVDLALSSCGRRHLRSSSPFMICHPPPLTAMHLSLRGAFLLPPNRKHIMRCPALVVSYPPPHPYSEPVGPSNCVGRSTPLIRCHRARSPTEDISWYALSLPHTLTHPAGGMLKSKMLRSPAPSRVKEGVREGAKRSFISLRFISAR
jgi:hypothetical protein